MQIKALWRARAVRPGKGAIKGITRKPGAEARSGGRGRAWQQLPPLPFLFVGVFPPGKRLQPAPVPRYHPETVAETRGPGAYCASFSYFIRKRPRVTGSQDKREQLGCFSVK